ncbi:Ig-like domain-containing protein [Clostridium acetobutylicum]|uniref:Ig-like domain-containing protein n=1 Tax=Clostridium acetobutylicum TaxID=1488 RepID=UPI001FA8E9BF|nr:Ig-like domain-containing protein [Clostridium acetobutylicum]
MLVISYSGGDFKADTNEVGVSYETHVQNVGWQNWFSDGVEAGTNGQGLRIEALKIKLVNAPVGAQISYSAHVQNVGWQDWVNDGAEAGTDGKGLRVEALKIKLVNMPDYTVQYQAHVQNIGWQNWVSDGAEAGTDGKGYRVEALRIKIVKKVAVQAITLNKASDELKVGQTDQLSAAFNPTDATNKNLSWTSSDASIASVDSSGKITALKQGTSIITATTEDGSKTANCSVTVNPGDLQISYTTHVQNVGWQNWFSDGVEAGTDGQGLRIEALKIKLVNAPVGAQISYSAHVQNVGWQDWVNDGAEAGTDGKGLRVEALKIKLVNMPDYTVQYQAHVQNIGWQNWVSDGAEAGTDGKGYRVEALRIKIVKKVAVQAITLNKASDELKVGQTDQLSAAFNPTDATNKNLSWTSSDASIASVDSSGKITALKQGTSIITATTEDGSKTANCSVTVNPGDLQISYTTHVQNVGWQNWFSDGVEAGTDGQGLRIEALKIKLLNAPAGAQITYRAHVQNVGWQNWVSDGTEAGTDGKGLRVEALQIKLVNMPDYTVQYQAHVQNVGWQNWVSDGAEAGTDGKGYRVEALKIRIVKKIAVQSITLNKNSDELNVGQTDQLSAVFNPTDATNKNIKWTSSDNYVATVDSTGKITAVSGGNAVITATTEDGSKTANCSIVVNSTDSKDNQALEKAKTVLNTIVQPGMTQVQKELAIHDYIVTNTQYETAVFTSDNVSDDIYTAYGALINHRAVCQGYAEAFKMMCNLVGIPTDIIEDFKLDHAWNIVKLDDGNYYQVDTTWDDPVYGDDTSLSISHEYFNLSDRQMFADHTIDKDKWHYPKAAVDNSEFYSISGDSYDSNVVYTNYNGKLSSVDSSGNMKTLNDDPSASINYYNGSIYYLSGSSIYKVDTNGQNKVQIASGDIRKMYLYNGAIYYLDANDFSINKLVLDGTYKNKKVIGITWNSSYFINNGCLYYEAYDDDYLHKVDLQSLTNTKILTVSDYYVTSYSNYLFYKDSNNLYRTDLNGGNSKLIVNNITDNFIDIFENYIYYNDSNNIWYKMNLDGSNLIKLMF